ncbi:septal ring lytic transglycosylase RlpA family protein [Brevundimonas subvibrioides]|uniref:septal ring lytic transglycosylase RlpA family protein n=1 Tax=Brevundimonas subvibrioides TaxID=74313 RepID=UPI0022B52F26|nr:septal ring lytic transglycosylase RlpA family protein [Brevundimonas subvibrioides]
MAKLRRALGFAAVGAGLSMLAACVSAGAPAGMRRAVIPVVADPAPIVSGTMRPYQVGGRWYRPAEQPDYDEVGMASWYGDQFNGRPTSTGERFDMHALTAAHKTLPLPGLVEVTNLANGRTVVLRVNDRGPFVDDRIIDLSRGAAEALDLLQRGVGEVRVRYLGRAPRVGGGGVLSYAGSPPRPPAAIPEPLPGPAASSARFWIEVAAYPTQPEARATASRLGETARVQAATDNSRFRVLLGPWPDANAAEQARQAVVERGFRDALLISAR